MDNSLDGQEIQSMNSQHDRHSSFLNLGSILEKISFEDILLFAILFLLLQEEVQDEFLIIFIVFLILTN